MNVANHSLLLTDQCRGLVPSGAFLPILRLGSHLFIICSLLLNTVCATCCPFAIEV